MHQNVRGRGGIQGGVGGGCYGMKRMRKSTSFSVTDKWCWCLENTKIFPTTKIAFSKHKNNRKRKKKFKTKWRRKLFVLRRICIGILLVSTECICTVEDNKMLLKTRANVFRVCQNEKKMKKNCQWFETMQESGSICHQLFLIWNLKMLLNFSLQNTWNKKKSHLIRWVMIKNVLFLLLGLL